MVAPTLPIKTGFIHAAVAAGTVAAIATAFRTATIGETNLYALSIEAEPAFSTRLRFRPLQTIGLHFLAFTEFTVLCALSEPVLGATFVGVAHLLADSRLAETPLVAIATASAAAVAPALETIAVRHACLHTFPVLAVVPVVTSRRFIPFQTFWSNFFADSEFATLGTFGQAGFEAAFVANALFFANTLVAEDPFDALAATAYAAIGATLFAFTVRFTFELADPSIADWSNGGAGTAVSPAAVIATLLAGAICNTNIGGHVGHLNHIRNFNVVGRNNGIKWNRNVRCHDRAIALKVSADSTVRRPRDIPQNRPGRASASDQQKRAEK